MKFLILLSLAMVFSCQEESFQGEYIIIYDVHFLTLKTDNTTKEGLPLVEYKTANEMVNEEGEVRVGAICGDELDLAAVYWRLCWPDGRNQNPNISIHDASNYFNSTYLADFTPLFSKYSIFVLDAERNCSSLAYIDCGPNSDESNEWGTEWNEWGTEWNEWGTEGNEWGTEWNEWGTEWDDRNDSVVEAYFGGAGAELNVPGMDSVEVHIPEMEVQAGWYDIMQVLRDLWYQIINGY